METTTVKETMKTSYVDPAKQRWYRVINQQVLDRLLPEQSTPRRRMIYLDTGEALQTISLLKHGYRPENLLAVNADPREIAVLTETLDRIGYPRVGTRHGLFEDIAWGVQTDVLDFDGTGHIGKADGVGEILLTNAVYGTTPKVVSFTIHSGREHGATMAALKDCHLNNLSRMVPATTSSGRTVSAQHWWRLVTCLLKICNAASGEARTCLWHVNDWGWDVYQSESGSMMAWMAARLSPHRAHPTRAAQLKTSWSRRSALYGLGPECGLVQTVRASACPTWSDAQFKYCGFSAHEMARTVRVPHSGWPSWRRD